MTKAAADIVGPLIENSKDRASFRLVVAYHLQTDSLVCRFDAKCGDKQKGSIVHAFVPINRPEDKISPDGPLIAPKGVIEATAIIADRKTLVAELRSLADHLESSK